MIKVRTVKFIIIQFNNLMYAFACHPQSNMAFLGVPGNKISIMHCHELCELQYKCCYTNLTFMICKLETPCMALHLKLNAI